MNTLAPWILQGKSISSWVHILFFVYTDNCRAFRGSIRSLIEPIIPFLNVHFIRKRPRDAGIRQHPPSQYIYRCLTETTLSPALPTSIPTCTYIHFSCRRCTSPVDGTSPHSVTSPHFTPSYLMQHLPHSCNSYRYEYIAYTCIADTQWVEENPLPPLHQRECLLWAKYSCKGSGMSEIPFSSLGMMSDVSQGCGVCWSTMGDSDGCWSGWVLVPGSVLHIPNWCLIMLIWA